MPFARGNQLVWFSDFLDDGVFEAHDAPVAAGRRTAIWCASSIRRKRIFPIPAAPVLNRRAASDDEIFGRAERVRERLSRPLHRPWRADRAQAATRLGWTCTVHRTDHAPQAALIALHAAIGGA